MKCVTWLLASSLFVSLSTATYGEDKKPGELTDPIEILKRVDQAAKAVKAAKYKATFKSVGSQAMPEVQGTVTLKGWTGQGPEKFLIDATVKRPGSSGVTKVTIGSDGEDYFVIDHAKKKAYVDMDPAVLGTTGQPARNLFTLEFVHPEPFSDELKGKKQELKGSKTIGGVDCYEIHVVYASGRQEAVWLFGKKDFLPRARRDIFQTPQGQKIQTQRILTDLVVDSAVADQIFKFKLPDGYERIDDFAP